MKPLLFSLVLFAITWLAHAAWWRIALPRRHIAALLALFAAVPLAGLLAAPLLPGTWIPVTGEVPALLALYFGAAGCYVIVYTAIEHSSPTLVIVRALDLAGPQGVGAEDLTGLITDDLFVRPRLEALVHDGIVVQGADGWRMTARGRRAARIAAAVVTLFRIRGVA